MDSWVNILTAVAPPFLLLFIGGVARRKDWLGREADRTMSRFIVYILYPCFILYHVLGTETPVGAKEAWTAALFGFCSIAVGFLIARLVAKLCRIKGR